MFYEAGDNMIIKIIIINSLDNISTEDDKK